VFPRPANNIRLTTQLPHNPVRLFAKHADDIAKLPAADKAKVIGILCDNTKSSIIFPGKHPKTFLTAAGLTVFFGVERQFVGRTG